MKMRIVLSVAAVLALPALAYATDAPATPAAAPAPAAPAVDAPATAAAPGTTVNTAKKSRAHGWLMGTGRG